MSEWFHASRNNYFLLFFSNMNNILKAENNGLCKIPVCSHFLLLRERYHGICIYTPNNKNFKFQVLHASPFFWREAEGGGVGVAAVSCGLSGLSS